jgi:elongation factor G
VHHFKSEKIRNVVLVSHSGAGKSTLAEAMLFNAGAISRLGKVDDGTSTADYEPEEVKRKISINMSLLPCQWKDTKFNIIDTPGYPDFVAEVRSGIRVCEGAIVTICATSGVEVGTEAVWELTGDAGLPRMIFVNKMDRENADFFTTMKNIQNKLGRICLPIQLPIGAQKEFKGYVDLITMKAYTGNPLQETEVPSDIANECKSYREKLVESVVEVDDEIISAYLDGKEIGEAIAQGGVVPVLLGTGLNNLCIAPLMDAIQAYIPSPADAGPVKAVNSSTKEEAELEPSEEGPLAALVFKTTTDPHVGRVSCFRVYSGTISSNSQVWNINKNANERIGQLVTLRGKTQETAPQLSAGDIGAVTKLAVTVTNDTLGTREKPFLLATIAFPEPVYNMAVHPKSKADLDKMSSALPKIAEEDLTLKVQREPDIGEMLLCGMGDTHLEVAVEKMQRKFGADLVLETPKVPYKETITTSTKAEYKHKKQTGGHGQYGHVLLEMEPMERGQGFEFAEKIVGGAIPKNYIPAVEKGVNEARLEGVLAKYPAIDIRVKLYDGSYHPVDSSEMSFKIAGLQAFKKGLSQGQPILLEPIMNMTISVPDSFTGDIISDLNSKRARVLGMNPQGGFNIIKAQAPMAEILRYAIDLRSITQGRGTFTIEFSHYEEVPQLSAQKIISQKEKE